MTTATTDPDPVTLFRERNESIRASLIRRGRIQVLPPDEDEADEMHRIERADCDSGEG